MKSPFPGMDPYLEGWLWPDVHSSLAAAIRDSLSETISDRYSIRIETSVVLDDSPADSLSVSFPDVNVSSEHRAAFDVGSVATLAAPVLIPSPVPVRVPAVRIRTHDRLLVTSIEIVSPANKRGTGYQKFRTKWARMAAMGVSTVVIDLLRRGDRIVSHKSLDSADYVVAVTRRDTHVAGAWPIYLREALPTIPVPLLSPDPDARLELQKLLDGIYERARYANDIDYSALPPPPALNASDAAWARDRIAEATGATPAK
ncbi:hypothetical protein AYO38_04305 [bacterium SCGC AG-212-C10]|nr:hypothetical protein AYO38_04305 [bacterium SCGC AG-212-C10]